MADDFAKADVNKTFTLLAIDDTGQIRRVLVDTDGRLQFSSNVSIGTVKIEDATDPTNLLAVDDDGRIALQVGEIDLTYTIPQSTPVPLPPGTNPPGPWVPVDKAVGLMVTTTASGLIEGHVEWSNDGTTLNHPTNSGLFTGGASFTLPRNGEFFRIRVDNLETVPVDFTVTVVKLNTPLQPFMFPVGGTIDPSWNAVLVKNVQTGQQPDGDFENARVAGSDPNNTSSALLGANATFTGAGFDATGFVSILIVVNSNQPSATNGLKIQFSDDNFATLLREEVFTYTQSDTDKGRIYPVPVNMGEQYRIVYTNGPTAQTIFSLRAELSTVSIQPLTDNLGRGTALTSPGLRISQVLGRTHQEVQALAIAASGTLYTIPTGKTFHVTNINLGTISSSLTASGKIRLRDGGAGGTSKFTQAVEEASGTLEKAATDNNDYSEPLQFATSVFFEIVQGTVITDVTIVGYLEDV